MSEEELLGVLNQRSLEESQIAMEELTRRSMKDLRYSIEKLDKSTGMYSTVLIFLSIVILVVAVTIFPPTGILGLVCAVVGIGAVVIAWLLVNKVLLQKP